MSDCGRLERIEGQLVEGKRLGRAEIEHARHCAACATIIATAERMEASLASAARALIVEPMPPIADLLAADGRSSEPRRFAATGILASVVGPAIVVVLAVIVSLAALSAWQGRGGGFVPSPSPSPTPSATAIPTPQPLPADMAGWVQAAGASIWTHMDRIGPAPAMTLVRLERCGDSALVFFEDPSPSAGSPLLFGSGNYRDQPYEAGFGGAATSVDDPEAAYARSQHPPCTIVVDTTLPAAAALTAYLATDPHATAARVLATRLVTADIGIAYVDELQDGKPHQQILVLHRDGDRWTVTGAQGGDFPSLPAALGVTPLGVAKGMPDNRWVAVGVVATRIRANVVAVEITFEGFVHRYPVYGTAFVILLPANVGFSLPYAFVDAQGTRLEIATSLP